ncbi:helix-turn-helix domain-containing protein [Pseudoduganella sp. UC29_71]|jgi:AraC-like DNA-binding protein|uniref:helix-turn-helix domain-containing protein n=1 Tax=Pseudoduganella sp. UC29_71 TaxID=3350174 RepID=UPI00366A782D
MKIAQEFVSHPAQSFRYLRIDGGEIGRLHRHPQIELTWIERGSGVRFVGDSALPFEDGDMALLGPNLPHLWMPVAGARAQGLLVTVLQVPSEFFEQPTLPELAQLRGVLERAALGLRITGACHARVSALLARMPGLPALQRLPLLLEIFACLHEHAASLSAIAASRGAETGRPVQKVLDWIHGDIGGELRVEDAAAIACVSPAAFSRFFRRETGKTYSDYVRAIRCSAVCLQLRKTDRPIALIAQECGFANLSNFNRQFLAEVGVTPRQYRGGG